jgi:hypothetical protein
MFTKRAFVFFIEQPARARQLKLQLRQCLTARAAKTAHG